MESRRVFTGTYLLQKEGEEKHFGFIQGFSYLPDYSTEIKIYINENKFELKSDVDEMKLLVLDREELEVISKASSYVEGSLNAMISLSKRKLLKDDAYS